MKAQPLTVYLPDTRGVTVSRYGRGNMKIGMNVHTYSRPAGREWTCPGSTDECEDICYAKRIDGVVAANYNNNVNSDVPPIPVDCTLLRIHVSGDFDTDAYIRNWIARLVERPDVRAWAYTRSWRVPSLLPALEDLRALPNMQLFASMDSSTVELPPQGWRRAWIGGDERLLNMFLEPVFGESTNTVGGLYSQHNQLVDAGEPHELVYSYVCPEETGRRPDCASCNYCILGRRGDVTFLRH